MNIDPELKQQLKQQRLRQLQAQYFEYQMNKTAYEAVGATDQAAEMQKRMEDTEKVYAAVETM